MKEEETHEEYGKGYKMGMLTAFDFVIKYCEDMKEDMKHHLKEEK